MVLQVETPTDRDRIVGVVRAFGGSSSAAVLGPDCQTFSIEGSSGLIRYRTESGCAIVYGDPVCSEADLELLTEKFHVFGDKNFKNIIYIGATKAFKEFTRPRLCKSSVEFGEELIIDPHNDPREMKGEKGSLVRRKCRRALKMGTTVQEYNLGDLHLKQEMESLAANWLNSRNGPQIHISKVTLFSDPVGKRWFYATIKGEVVGVAVLNLLQSYRGWLLNHVMAAPGASPGISELLICTILETLKKEECHYVTFGSVPSSQLGAICGLGRFPSWLAGQIFRAAAKLFQLDGKKSFWQKHHPVSQPVYLLLSRPNIGITEVLALMRALHVSF